MPRGRPVEPEKRAQVLELANAGKGRNDIAAETGVSAATVTKIVHAAGGSFDRARTKAATEARKVDLAALRAEIAHALLAKARGFIADMDRPFIAFNFGGKDNTYNEHELDRPPTGDIRNLMTSTGIALQRSLELTKFDSDGGAGKAGNLLDALAAGIGEAARLLDNDSD